jgi:hypothetical protein
MCQEKPAHDALTVCMPCFKILDARRKERQRAEQRRPWWKFWG